VKKHHPLHPVTETLSIALLVYRVLFRLLTKPIVFVCVMCVHDRIFLHFLSFFFFFAYTNHRTMHAFVPPHVWMLDYAYLRETCAFRKSNHEWRRRRSSSYQYRMCIKITKYSSHFSPLKLRIFLKENKWRSWHKQGLLSNWSIDTFALNKPSLSFFFHLNKPSKVFLNFIWSKDIKSGFKIDYYHI
jgi:hypothetical protein